MDSRLDGAADCLCASPSPAAANDARQRGAVSRPFNTSQEPRIVGARGRIFTALVRSPPAILGSRDFAPSDQSDDRGGANGL